MRKVVTFLLLIDMMVMQRLSTEEREASSAESRQSGIIAWGMTVIVGLILILILIAESS